MLLKQKQSLVNIYSYSNVHLAELIMGSIQFLIFIQPILNSIATNRKRFHSIKSF